MLHVTIEELDKSVILHCVGRMVRGNETAILCAAVRQRERRIILDLSQVDAIDAAGVGALISLQAAGIYLQLMNPLTAVREVLRVTKLESVFEVCGPPLIVNPIEDSLRERSSGPLFPQVAIAT